MIVERRKRILIAIFAASVVGSWIAFAFEMYNRQQRQDALQVRIDALEAQIASTKKLIDQRK
jgi:hypothetical protein